MDGGFASDVGDLITRAVVSILGGAVFGGAVPVAGAVIVPGLGLVLGGCLVVADEAVAGIIVGGEAFGADGFACDGFSDDLLVGCVGVAEREIF